MRWSCTALVLLCGCTSLYDGGDYFSADQLDVDIELIGPLDEGRPGLLVVATGSSIASGATIEVSWGNRSLVQPEVTTPAVVSTDGTIIAAEVALPVLSEVGAGQSVQLLVAVRQQDDDRAIRVVEEFTVAGLNELVWACEEPCDALDTDELEPLYSRIEIRATGAGDYGVAPLAGTGPAVFEASSEIVLDAFLDVTGPDAPGACAGGGTATAADCDGGGQGGSSISLPPLQVVGRASGGGGGGHRVAGQAGGPFTTVAGGAASGTRWLQSLEDHQPGGGGGGGSVNRQIGGNLIGGVGGPSGGVVRLSAPRITGRFAIDAQGGSGADGPSDLAFSVACDQVNPLLRAGGGGGGGGGAVVLAATEELSLVPLTLDAGSGGIAVNAAGGRGGNEFLDRHPACPTGGRGADGYIRIDAPLVQLPYQTVPLSARGPTFLGETTITREPEPLLTVTVEPGEYQTTVNGEPGPRLLSVGFGQVAPTLVPGANQVCVHVDGDVVRKCYTVVYVP